jgi:hypothetical protein
LNLVLSFVHARRRARTLGPFAAVCLEADCVRERPGGPALATQVDHRWIVGGEPYFRLECEARIAVHFESPARAASRRFGPFERFAAADGIAYADGGVIASVDRRSREWLAHLAGAHWPVMVLSDAAEGAAGARALALAALCLAPLGPGVYGLWDGERLIDASHAGNLRAQLAAKLVTSRRVTTIAWSSPHAALRRESAVLRRRSTATIGRARETHARAARLRERSRALCSAVDVRRDCEAASSSGR